jgi:hypothetical protein
VFALRRLPYSDAESYSGMCNAVHLAQRSDIVATPSTECGNLQSDAAAGTCPLHSALVCSGVLRRAFTPCLPGPTRRCWSVLIGKFQLVTPVSVKIVEVMSCSFPDKCLCFGGAYCLHLQNITLEMYFLEGYYISTVDTSNRDVTVTVPGVTVGRSVPKRSQRIAVQKM